MKKFHYHNTERHFHKGKHTVRSVRIHGNTGFKSVSTRQNTKRKTVRKPLTKEEICKIKKRKFIQGLFDDCQQL